jgi:hypothetical protein
MFEGVLCCVMFWLVFKCEFKCNDFMECGVMNDAYFVQVWDDVVKVVAKGDFGVNVIVDELFLVMEWFMGNYFCYNCFEKNFLHLIFPFYK